MWQPIATIPPDTFVLVTDDATNLIPEIRTARLRTAGGFQYIGESLLGGANFWAPQPTA